VIRPAELSWRDGQPWARDYEDIYHAADGAAEVQRVFLEPSNFSSLLEIPETLLVGELGFGTGLNFAVIAEACRAARKRVHFVSFDRAPLSGTDFNRVVGERQRQFPVYAELGRHYPSLLPGWHRRSLAGGLITLSLFWGEADDGVSQLVAQQKRPFDLWLLDGFAPDRNPDMWRDELFEKLAKVSREGARVATFTSAGRVRRGLNAAGFEMRRVDQRPHKRESLAGALRRGGMTQPPATECVSVIGAGIAGASVARHLADAGIPVVVSERQAIASGASAIPATVMHGRLLPEQNANGLLRAHAYLYARAFCERFAAEPGLKRASALQVPSDSYPTKRLAAVAEAFAASGDWLRLLDADQATAVSGLTFFTGVLQFHDTWIIDTPALCRALLEHPNIQTIESQASTDWPENPTVVAGGYASRAFAGVEYLELAEVGGQIDLFAPQSTALAQLPVALVGNGYLAPTDLGLAAGATYEYQPWTPEDASSTNLGHLRKLTGVGADDVRWRSSHRGTRSVSSDRTPIVGQLVDPAGHPLEGRYVSTGHGSMGTVTSHMGAALLSSQIVGDFLPMAPGPAELLSPRRFRARQAKRGYKFGARY
jgi:tRNA 5-methylaminomethyl-2-thiouridine biosynthesis bifunctional protein